MTAFWYSLQFHKIGSKSDIFLRMCYDDIFIILAVMVYKYY